MNVERVARVGPVQGDHADVVGLVVGDLGRARPHPLPPGSLRPPTLGGGSYCGAVADVRAWWADWRRRKPVQTWWADIRRRRPIAEFVGELADRDQEAQGSVLGSAVALRLFLFLVPSAVVIVSLIVLLDIPSLFDGDQLEKGYTTAGHRRRPRGRRAGWTRCGSCSPGLVLAAWAGRSLARVLAACSAAAWRLPASEAKVNGDGRAHPDAASCSSRSSRPRSCRRIRDLGGAPAWALSWGTLVAIVGVAWFLVLLTLPRGGERPRCAAPGRRCSSAWCRDRCRGCSHAYTEGRVERTVDTYGDLAVTLAILGNLFILGRLMTASFVVVAVTYERFGSLSETDLRPAARAPAAAPLPEARGVLQPGGRGRSVRPAADERRRDALTAT